VSSTARILSRRFGASLMALDGPQNFHVFFQLELANHRPQTRNKGLRLRLDCFPFLKLCLDTARITDSTQQKFIG